MGRTARFTDAAILDTTLDIVAEDGAHAATAVAIAKRLGAPSGSIYHRFASRDLILATLWTRTVQQFQSGFLNALAHDEPLLAARQAVSYVLAWSTTHPREARVLTMYRREDLIALWPEELGDELATLNDAVGRAVVAFTAAHFGTTSPAHLGRAQLALIGIPYAAVRHMLRSTEPLPWLEATVTAASLEALTHPDPTG